MAVLRSQGRELSWTDGIKTPRGVCKSWMRSRGTLLNDTATRHTIVSYSDSTLAVILSINATMQNAQVPASLTSCQANTSSLPLDAPFVPTTNRAAEERPLLFSYNGRLDADDKQPAGRFDGLYTWWMSSGYEGFKSGTRETSYGRSI